MNEYTFKDLKLDRDDIYRQHQQVKGLFRDEGQVRFRVEGPKVIVHSDLTPTGNVSCSLRKLSSCKSGEKKSFKLRAYVEKRKFVKNGKGPRLPIRDLPGIVNWINRVSSDNGFAVAEFKMISNPYTLVGVKGEEKLIHNAVDFEGVLEVKDDNLFSKAIESGIGPGKSFGFGLLYFPE